MHHKPLPQVKSFALKTFSLIFRTGDLVLLILYIFSPLQVINKPPEGGMMTVNIFLVLLALSRIVLLCGYLWFSDNSSKGTGKFIKLNIFVRGLPTPSDHLPKGMDNPLEYLTEWIG